MAKRKTIASEYRDVVILEALTRSRRIVLKLTLSLEAYYEDLHAVIDDDAFRKRRRIRYLRGKIYEPTGELRATFVNEYDREGGYQHGRRVEADGTVSED